MSEVRWIKILTTIFEDEKIKLIQSMPEGDALIVIWLKLLTQAGRTNNYGYVHLNENTPYTPTMLSILFNKSQPIIDMALRTFEQFGMIENTEKGIYVSNWEKHQNTEGLEKIREQTRKRVAAHRDRLKLPLCNVTDRYTVTVCNVTDIELDIDKEKEKKERYSSKVFADDSLEMVLAFELKNHILENNPKGRIPQDLNGWASDFDKMMRIDNQKVETIREVMNFCQTDKFWLSNILSAKKLREKFDTLYLQMKNRTTEKKPTISTDARLKALEDM